MATLALLVFFSWVLLRSLKFLNKQSFTFNTFLSDSDILIERLRLKIVLILLLSPMLRAYCKST